MRRRRTLRHWRHASGHYRNEDHHDQDRERKDYKNDNDYNDTSGKHFYYTHKDHQPDASASEQQRQTGKPGRLFYTAPH